MLRSRTALALISLERVTIFSEALLYPLHYVGVQQAYDMKYV